MDNREPSSVLLVDDAQDNIDVLTMVLQLWGYEVRGAANGREALDRLQLGGPVDLILLDLMMPVMDGTAFLKELRRCPAFAHIPVVLISGEGDLAQRAHLLNVSGYLQKPIDVAALLRLVAQVLGKH